MKLEGTHRVRTHTVLLYPNPNPDLDLWPFNPQNHVTSKMSQPYTKFEHFGIIRFWDILRTNRQTKKQTALNVLPTPTDRADVGKIDCRRSDSKLLP